MPIEITYLGRNCFRLKGRDGTVITDPCPPDSGFTLGKQTAEVVTLSRKDDPGYSWAEGVGVTCTEAALVTVTVSGRTPGVLGNALGFRAHVTETAPKER